VGSINLKIEKISFRGFSARIESLIVKSNALLDVLPVIHIVSSSEKLD